MRIHKDFVGGNILVKSVEDDTVILENELRDTTQDWFYWAFCVEGAAGRMLTFNMQKTRLGYFGPAVSCDLKEWHWLHTNTVNADSFTYRFAEDEDCVYFAHHMLYHPDRFLDLINKMGLEPSELCKSRKGRSVPCLTIGNGAISIILTARHHACESTGSYVLEGVLRELMDAPIPTTRIFCVPFVDFDGVLDGDQGKGRIPHDHNRDYTDEPIYPEVQAICEYARECGCHYGFDFHSPWHKGGENDKIFIVRNMEEKQDRFDAFSRIFEAEITENSMCYNQDNDHPPKTGWNQPSTNFGYTMNSRPECILAFTLESAYFGTEENRVSASKLIELGRCYAKAIRRYVL